MLLPVSVNVGLGRSWHHVIYVIIPLPNMMSTPLVHGSCGFDSPWLSHQLDSTHLSNPSIFYKRLLQTLNCHILHNPPDAPGL
jgi:hypothetical protein